MFPDIFIDTINATVTGVVARDAHRRFVIVDLYDHNECGSIGITLNRESAEAMGRMLLALAEELY
jgi:putative AlgH/UPF0301 family transcriptional regulator